MDINFPMRRRGACVDAPPVLSVPPGNLVFNSGTPALLSKTITATFNDCTSSTYTAELDATSQALPAGFTVQAFVPPTRNTTGTFDYSVDYDGTPVASGTYSQVVKMTGAEGETNLVTVIVEAVCTPEAPVLSAAPGDITFTNGVADVKSKTITATFNPCTPDVYTAEFDGLVGLPPGVTAAFVPPTRNTTGTFLVEYTYDGSASINNTHPQPTKMTGALGDTNIINFNVIMAP